MISRTPIYVDKPAYSAVSKWILPIIISSTLIMGLILIPIDIIGAWVMLGLTVFDGLLIWSVLPKQFEVYEDRLKIQLHGLFAINIFYPDLKGIKQTNREDAYVYWGLRFATSTKYVVEIDRRKGMNVIISPASEGEFIEQVNRAKANYREPDFDTLYEEKTKNRM